MSSCSALALAPPERTPGTECLLCSDGKPHARRQLTLRVLALRVHIQREFLWLEGHSNNNCFILIYLLLLPLPAVFFWSRCCFRCQKSFPCVHFHLRDPSHFYISRFFRSGNSTSHEISPKSPIFFGTLPLKPFFLLSFFVRFVIVSRFLHSLS